MNRSTDDLRSQRLAEANTALAKVFGRGDPVYLALSGGKDSTALAHLCEPWRDLVTLVTINTGFNFPHVLDSVRSFRDRGFRLEEIQSDLLAVWNEHGVPATIIPAAHMFGLGHDKPEPKMQPWFKCCALGITYPLIHFFRDQPKPLTFLHAQRAEDGAPGTEPGGVMAEQFRQIAGAGIDVVAPLWGWSEDDIMTYIAEHDIELPEQYSHGIKDSLDCWCCPANYYGTHGKAFADWFSRSNPELESQVRPLVVREIQIAARAAAALSDALQPGP